MGIPYYFRTLLRKYPHLLTPPHDLVAPTLAWDFNCVLHGVEDPLDVIRKVLALFRTPPTTVYVAIDGVVPKAKQIQQRRRRWDAPPAKNQISPCTPYMKEVERRLRDAFPSFIVSGSDEEGEGEQKLMRFLRANGEPAVVYGMDADLIVLTLGLKQPIWLLRENQDRSLSDRSRGSLSDRDAWNQLDVAGLRNVLPMALDHYREASSVWGNDFVPPLLPFILRLGGYERWMDHPSLEFWEGQENAVCARYLRRPPSVAPRRSAPSASVADAPRRSAAPSATQEVPWTLERQIRWTDVGWRDRYYRLTMGITHEEDIQILCEMYWGMRQWIRDYYEGKPVSWTAHYPWAYPPLLQDLLKYRTPTVWTPSQAPSVHDQLRYILPPSSWDLCGLGIHPDHEKEVPKVGLGGLFKTFEWECVPQIPL